MTCEETRQTLSLYVDDCVSLPTRVAIDEHLDRCPVCRAEVVELRSLTRSLKMMTRPVAPAGLAGTITDLLTIEAAARQAPKVSFGRRVARFIEPRLMPYTVGSFASVILFFLMFTALRPHFVALREAALNNASYTVRPVPAMPGYDLYWPVDSESFAASRAPFGEESPSLNPKGALAAFTRAHLRPSASHNHDADTDDIIFGAVVFRDGTASLVDVVQVPRDRRILDELETALRQDPSFVPASFDRRPDTMRFYFTLGTKVEVYGQNF